MAIVDFSDLEYSDKNGSYGGNSYTTSPLSEYIGSHVYEILGYDVHETLLVVRNEKLDVACKDFCGSDIFLREIRTIKNFANKELSNILESKSSGEANMLVDIDELLPHLNYNDMQLKDL